MDAGWNRLLFSIPRVKPPSPAPGIPIVLRHLLMGWLLLAALPHAAHARASGDGIWQDVNEQTILAHGSGQRFLIPKSFRTLTLDLAGAKSLLAGAPFEFTAQARSASPVLTLPLPNGSFGQFYVQESPVMEPELAAKLPDVRTYRGQGIDDPSAMARLDFTPEGFHGLIFSAAGTIYIDPYRQSDTAHYISYWRRDYLRSSATPPFQCGYDANNAPKMSIRTLSTPRHAAALASRGATLRTYRLALAATGEYTAFHGGTVAGAQAAMVTTMNRINGIFEKDLAIRMTMVDNTSIVFTNATADPYLNSSSDLTANQITIDANIGSGNYDIGHLVGTGGGGVAYVGVVCDDAYKARGLTGSNSPVGDAFDVDYVAHEMGHQFGGSHTFNGTTAACGGGNRDSYAAYEPGSGSTIMAYAGICAEENLQPHSDPYFHAFSFDEIVDYTSGLSCAVETNTGNDPPAVSAGPAITIPRFTPFYLTGSGSDPNGDTLTFGWEEFDIGAASPPNTDDGTRPLFRSFNPTSSPVRIFPRLSEVIATSLGVGEWLPETGRTMHFRLTARDNVTGVNSATTTVTVAGLAGPFSVTGPDSAVVWGGATMQTVTWNVAGTSGAPVSCASVKILLSADGGNTYPTTVLANTPNDGSQAINVPNTPTTTARMRVECATSRFFDISNADFTITPAIFVVATATDATTVAVSWNAIPDAVSYQIFRRAAGGSFTMIGTSVTTAFTDDTAAADAAYLYAVKSVDALSVASPLSAPDLATTVIFTDPSLAPSVTFVKAAHITQLRTAVNAVRSLATLGAFSFTDPTIVAGVTPPKAVHTTELRTALDAARSALALPAVTYTDPTLTALVTPIKSAHIDDLRNGVK